MKGKIMQKQIEILLAEDNSDDVLLIKKAFLQAKLVNIIRVVRDGEEALAYLQQQGRYKDAQRPGLVLLDIRMPKKNGFEVLEELKRNGSLRNLPVVILTTSNAEEDIAKSYASGACSFITKPVNCEEFKKLVERFELYWVLVSQIPHYPEE